MNILESDKLDTSELPTTAVKPPGLEMQPRVTTAVKTSAIAALRKHEYEGYLNELEKFITTCIYIRKKITPNFGTFSRRLIAERDTVSQTTQTSSLQESKTKCVAKGDGIFLPIIISI